MDINIIKKIIMYNITSIVHVRRGLRKEILKLRLVSKQWKRAVEQCDDAWSMVYGSASLTEHSVHRTDLACKGRKRGESIPCYSVYHFTHLYWTPQTFNDILTKSRKRILNRTRKRLKEIEPEFEKLEEERKRLKKELTYF